MEEKLKKPLHVKEGKVVKTPSEMGTSSGTVEKTSTDKSMKEKMGEKKEDMSSKIHEVKEGASKQKEDIQKGISDATEEAKKNKEEFDKESEKEGMTPAEKVLNDIVTRFRQGTDQINEAISDYNAKPEGGKESKGSKGSKGSKNVLKPLVDVLETNETVYLIADISGVKKDNINIGISKKSVELTVDYKEDPEIEDAKFTQKERSYGETHRTVQLSSEVKVHEAKANFRNCTLKITLPKVVEDVTKVNIDD